MRYEAGTRKKIDISFLMTKVALTIILTRLARDGLVSGFSDKCKVHSLFAVSRPQAKFN